MILCIRTDSPVVFIALVDASNKRIISEKEWEAGRSLASTLLSEIDNLLMQAGYTSSDISGVVVYEGPGSFTGLRIGITVANTLAYANGVAIIGTSGEEWIERGLGSIVKNHGVAIVLPVYGAEANITM